jgi:hypothetical protein
VAKALVALVDLVVLLHVVLLPAKNRPLRKPAVKLPRLPHPKGKLRLSLNECSISAIACVACNVLYPFLT